METLLRIGLSNAVVAAALALLAATVGLLFRKPALTHGLWLLVLLKLVSPPLWTIPLHVPVASGKPISAVPQALGHAPVATAPQSAEPVTASDIESDLPLLDNPPLPVNASAREIPWTQLGSAHPPATAAASRPSYRWIAPAVLAFWLIGSTICTVVSIGRLVCFRRMMLNCAVPAPQAIQRQARALSRRLGMAACPDVWLVPGEVSPMLWAAGGATWVLLPRRLLERLDEQQRATLLAHELAHLRRRDHWVRYLELITTCLYWWHPVCWWAQRELREAGEQCCDAWVLWALPGSFRQYATALLEAIEFLSQPRPSVPLLASGLGQFGQLKRRLTMLKRGTVSKALTWRGLCGLCGAAALLLPLVPTLAQQAEEPRKDDTASPQEQSANRIRAAAGQEAVEPEEADEANAQQERAQADAERAQADAERAQADAGRKQSDVERAVEEAVDRAQALAERAGDAAKEQAAKAMAEAEQALAAAAKEQGAEGKEDGDGDQPKQRELRDIARQAQREAAQAIEQAKREMAQAMGEAKRAMAEAKRQAQQAQREAMRRERDGEGDLRRQLEDAHRQIRELSKRLAEAQQQLGGAERRGGPGSPFDAQPGQAPGPRGRSSDQREERLQRLEQQLQALLGEVRSMRQERNDSSGQRGR